MTTIGGRVGAAMHGAGMQQKELAQRVGMTPDALSRALRDQRGFAAVELAAIAEVLDADVHELITGAPDPHRLVLAARHSFDHDTGARSVAGLDEDHSPLADVRLAYAQISPVRAPLELPSDVEGIRRLLHPDFVRPFVDRLAEIEVDVVRIDGPSTAYSFLVEERPVILLPESGNWFHENWSLAHELGHLALRHEGVVPGTALADVKEREANAFAAELLLPAVTLQQIDWAEIRPAEVAELVWTWGISTGALSRRLKKLELTPSAEVAEVLTWSTQKLLRRHWTGAKVGDPITRRMRDAGERRFPTWLQEAHLEQIAEGAVGKGTLAWMLGVPVTSLEVDEPAAAEELSEDALAELIG
ncbi:helix-turn-helix domain-containing protein [Brachybacterium paraconglomeratum]|uniref:helix-turn-helix domain-containing protein n=1 Tax=Brachybacterium paraconglomeratum TaxID=173362 RepID=UPI003FD05049